MKKIAALVLVTLLIVLAIMPAVSAATSWPYRFIAGEHGSVTISPTHDSTFALPSDPDTATAVVKVKDRGITYTITAVPDKGYRFVEWQSLFTLDCGTYKAIFEAIPYDPETKQPEGYQGFYEAPAAEVTEVATVETVTAPQTADTAPVSALIALLSLSAAAMVALKKRG